MTDSFNKLFTPSPYPAQNWSPTCFEQKHVNCQDSQGAFCGLWILCGVSREKKQMSSTMLKWTFNKNLPFITLSKGGRRTSLRVEAKTLWSRNVETDVRPLSDYLLSAICIFLVFPIFFVVMQNLFAALRNVSSGNTRSQQVHSRFDKWRMYYLQLVTYIFQRKGPDLTSLNQVARLMEDNVFHNVMPSLSVNQWTTCWLVYCMHWLGERSGGK